MTASDTIARTALTLLVAGAGASAFALAGFPAPFLTGPAVAVTAAILAGAPLTIPAMLRDACFVILGLGIGASVTPEVVRAAATWPLSLGVLAGTLSLGLVLSARFLARGFGFDAASAVLAAVPGHLSYVVSLSAELRADIARIALVQSMRVLFLTLLVPLLLTLFGAGSGAPEMPAATMRPAALVALAGVALAAGLALRRAGAPAALLIAGMLVSGAGHATGLSPGALPGWLSLGAFTVMGALIGTRFRGQTLAAIRRDLWAGAGVTLIACGVAAVAGVAVARAMDLPPALLVIAFAPGGVEAMAAMAVQIGVEPTFVAAHHIFRLLILTVLVPLMLRRARAAR